MEECSRIYATLYRATTCNTTLKPRPCSLGDTLMVIVDCVAEEKRMCDAGGLEVGLRWRWRSAMAWPRMFREQAAAALEKVEAKSGVEVGGQ